MTFFYIVVCVSLVTTVSALSRSLLSKFILLNLFKVKSIADTYMIVIYF